MVTATPTRRKLSYTLYTSFRRDGLSPLEIQGEWAVLSTKTGMSLSGLVSIVIGVVAFCAVDAIVNKLLGRRFSGETLWIVSPSGKTTEQLPFCVALRIVRKRKWSFADVEPVQPRRIVGRKEALMILLRGDR